MEILAKTTNPSELILTKLWPKKQGRGPIAYASPQTPNAQPNWHSPRVRDKGEGSLSPHHACLLPNEGIANEVWEGLVQGLSCELLDKKGFGGKTL